jgi:hypothetical protein
MPPQIEYLCLIYKHLYPIVNFKNFMRLF